MRVFAYTTIEASPLPDALALGIFGKMWRLTEIVMVRSFFNTSFHSRYLGNLDSLLQSIKIHKALTYTVIIASIA